MALYQMGVEGLVSDWSSKQCLLTPVSSDEEQMVKPKGVIKAGLLGVRRVLVQSWQLYLRLG